MEGELGQGLPAHNAFGVYASVELQLFHFHRVLLFDSNDCRCGNHLVALDTENTGIA